MASSWLNIPPSSPFPLANLPLGVLTRKSTQPISHDHNEDHDRDQFIGTAIGSSVLNLTTLSHTPSLSSLPPPLLTALRTPPLNSLASLPRAQIRLLRTTLQTLLRDAAHEAAVQPHLLPLEATVLHLPFRIGDYTDFYAGIHHARNCGMLFRSAADALNPNYTHMPVAYHGRASSVVVTGTPVRRPHGQILATQPEETGKGTGTSTTPRPQPVFAPTAGLDFELELGCFVGGGAGNPLGSAIPVADAADRLFGLVLLNDWSARDVQGWEMVPLGPFLAKSFATSVGGWVVLMDALEGCMARPLDAEAREDALLGYLREGGRKSLPDLKLEVEIRTASGASATIARTTSLNLLYSFPQMLAHHTSNGCPVRPGDLLGSGTVSGAEDPREFGSLLEQTRGGRVPVAVGDRGETRLFLEDGDEVVLTGSFVGEGGVVCGLGECRGRVLPAG